MIFQSFKLALLKLGRFVLGNQSKLANLMADCHNALNDSQACYKKASTTLALKGGIVTSGPLTEIKPKLWMGLVVFTTACLFLVEGLMKIPAAMRVGEILSELNLAVIAAFLSAIMLFQAGSWLIGCWFAWRRLEAFLLEPTFSPESTSGLVAFNLPVSLLPVLRPEWWTFVVVFVAMINLSLEGVTKLLTALQAGQIFSFSEILTLGSLSLGCALLLIGQWLLNSWRLWQTFDM